MLMSDWLGDIAGQVLLFNFVLFGPQRLPPARAVAITWRSLRQLVLLFGVALLG